MPQVWTTLRAWIDADVPDAQLVLVSCAPLLAKDPLNQLALTRQDRDISAVLAALVHEAERVRDARHEAEARDEPKLPYEDRAPGVYSFLALTTDARTRLVERIAVIPNSPNILEVRGRIVEYFEGWVEPEIRESFVTELLKWWDYRACRSLVGELPRRISRAEVYREQAAIRSSLTAPALPESYSRLHPTDPADGLSTTMERQIALVKGGAERLERASLARWRARRQRDEWLTGDLSLRSRFAEFDELLEARWNELFAPLSHDLEEADEATCEQSGRRLLDWSHVKARQEIPTPTGGVRADYLVPGSYQQLADELRVGWHRDWKTLMQEDNA